MDKVSALVLAGGRGGDFGPLSEHRTKAAFPIAGHYRIIDFVLSNLSHSGIRQVGMIIQYLPASLMEHIGSGRAWDFDLADRHLRFMTPFVGIRETRWFRGTGDAIGKNMNLFNGPGIEDVLVLSGEHVYAMDYQALLTHHRRTNADVTMACISIPHEAQHPRFGNVIINQAGQVLSFIEKPLYPVSPLVSMGIYCFKRDVLLRLLTETGARHNRDEFSLAGDILQPNIGELNGQAWIFEKPWHYLPDLRQYYEFHMQLADGRITLFEDDFAIMTNFMDRAMGSRVPTRYGQHAKIQSSVISPGCCIEGHVERSVLSPGVYVHPSAIVTNSIIFHDSHIGPGCHIDHAIIDKDVVMDGGARIGALQSGAAAEAGPELTVVPKGYHVAQGEVIQPGTNIDAPALF